MKKDNLFNTYLNILNEQAEAEDAEMDDIEVKDAEVSDSEADDVEEISTGSSLDNLIKEYEEKETITKEDIVKLLNIAVCDEILASFNYMISYNLSKTEGKEDFDGEFEQHEDEEREHAEKLIKRLREMNAEVLTTGWSDYLTKNSCGEDWTQETSNDSIEILKHRYQEELDAIKYYKMVLNCVKKLKESGEWDASTERLIKGIISDEEGHELDLRDLLVQYGIEVGETPKESFNPDNEEDFEEDFEEEPEEDEDFESEEDED